MKIAGLSKLTLLDYPGKTACTIFTKGCNFVCPFCHNSSLVVGMDDEEIAKEEIFSFLQSRKGLLEGVCITGGEPTMQKDLPEFIKEIKDMGFLVKLDTNGENFSMLETLYSGGYIDYVAMDIKNCLSGYGETIGRANFDTTNIKKSINLLLVGNLPFEFRTTVVKEFFTAESFVEIGKTIAGATNYFLQPFRPSENCIVSGLNSPTNSELESYLEIAKEYVPNAKIREI